MAKEWATFSSGYIPLRVSNPKGNQVSTFRLQLPYKYSVPLILISILLHWILSNTLYLTVSVGGYFFEVRQSQGISSSDAPFQAFLAVGYSGWALMLLLVLSCILICIPIITGLSRLPENSIVVGSNSFAIATSCHISPLSKIDDMSNDDTKSDAAESDARSEWLISARNSMDIPAPNMEDAPNEYLEKISQCELKWGVVSVPKGWPLQDSDDLEEDAATVGHISFGTKMDEVSVPEVGKLYA